MAIQVDRIDDKADGFTVEFTVVNKYKRTFATRPAGIDQLSYAREQVQSIVTNPVEKPDGVVIVAKPVVAEINEQPTVTDLDVIPEPETPVEEPIP